MLWHVPPAIEQSDLGTNQQKQPPRHFEGCLQCMAYAKGMLDFHSQTLPLLPSNPVLAQGFPDCRGCDLSSTPLVVVKAVPIQQLHFDVDGGLLKENISMEKRKNLYLICKEAINNAVKYSSCKNLTLSFNKNKNLLVVTIIDDGQGFDLENHVDGNGIKNIKQRSGQIGCKLKLISNSKEGTMLILECPLS